MDRLPPLSAIRAFEAAGRHENFSRAADELGLTQAAVSYQIRQLEDRVGRPLFVREKGRVRLSDSGRRLLPALTSGFAGIAEAFAALREEDEDVLELNTAVSFGGTWLSARIGRFQVRYPDLAVRISLANEVIDFSRGGVDAVIRTRARAVGRAARRLPVPPALRADLHARVPRSERDPRARRPAQGRAPGAQRFDVGRLVRRRSASARRRRARAWCSTASCRRRPRCRAVSASP